VFAGATFALMPLAIIGQRTYAAVDLNLLGSPYRDAGTVELPANGVQTDVTEAQPMIASFWRDARDGTVQQWSPYIAGGAPTGVLSIYGEWSPFAWPYLVLPAWYAATVKAALVLLMAQIGTYLLARRMQLGVAAATVAGVAYAFCGTNLVFLHRVGAVAVAPALLWAGHRLVSAPRAREGLLVGGLLAWSWHEGFPAAFLFNGYALAAWTGWLVAADVLRGGWSSIRSLDWWPKARRQVLALGLAGLVAVGLSAITLFSSLEQIRERGYLETETRQYGEHSHLAGAAVFSLFDARALGDPITGPLAGVVNSVEGLATVGSIALLGAAVAMVLVAAGRLRLPVPLARVWPFLVLGTMGFVVLTYVGTPLLAAVYHLPGLSNNLFHRSRYLLALLVALIAVAPLDAWWRRSPRATTAPGVASRVVSAAGVVVLVGVPLRYRADFFDAVRAVGGVPPLRSAVLRSAVLTIAAVAVALVAGTRRVRERGGVALGVVLLAALVWVQLAWPLRTFNPQASTRLYYAQTDLHREVKSLAGDRYRIAGTGLYTLYPNQSQLTRVADLRGVALQDPDYERLVTVAAPNAFGRDPFKVIAFPSEMDVASRALDDLAVRYIVVSTDEQPLGDVVPAADFVAARVPTTEADGPVPPPSRAGAPDRIAGVELWLIRNGCAAGMVQVTLRAGATVLDTAARPVADVGDGWLPFALTGQRVATDLASARDDLHLTVESPDGCDVELGVSDAGGHTVPAVQWIVESADAVLRLVWTGPGWVYERPSAREMISVATAWTTYASKEAATAAVKDAGAAVPISGDRPTGSFGGEARILDSSISVRGAEATVDSDDGALVVFSINDDPSMRVEVDGHNAAAVSVDGALVGVFVERGEHRVTVRYRNATFRNGALLTAFTAVACGAWLVWERTRGNRRARRARVREEDVVSAP
jgi:hypothetical protein